MPESIAKSAPRASGRWPSGVQTRVVDGEQRARGVRGLGRGGDVDEVEPRVGRRLDPHERRALARAGDRGGVGRHEPDLDPERLRAARSASAADPRVAVAAGDEHVAGAQHGEQHGGDRGHAGGEHGALAAVELAERALQVRPGRVARRGRSRRAPRPCPRAGGRARRAPARAAAGRPARRRARPAWIERVLGPLIARTIASRGDATPPARAPAARPRAPCRRAPRCSRRRAMLRAARLEATTGRCSPPRGPRTWPSCCASPAGARARSSSAPPPAGPRARCCSPSRSGG